VLREIKWNILCVDLISVAHVVSDNINHHPDVLKLRNTTKICLESLQYDYLGMIFIVVHTYFLLLFTSSMGSFNECFQTSFITKVFVNLCEVLCSISVVLIRVIIRNRGDPNCIETEILKRKDKEG